MAGNAEQTSSPGGCLSLSDSTLQKHHDGCYSDRVSATPKSQLLHTDDSPSHVRVQRLLEALECDQFCLLLNNHYPV
jgi:hypothetical protein